MADKYPQPLYISVTQTAANVLTLSDPLRVGTDLFENKALLIHKIEYYPGNNLSELAAEGDTYKLAICVAEVDELAPDDAAVVHQMNQIGSSSYTEEPVVFEFLTPIIIPQYEIYLGIKTGGFAAAAAEAQVKIYVTGMELKGNEYLELLQAMRLYK